MNGAPGNPYLRLLACIMATAVAIHVTWLLIKPVLPFLAVLITLIVIARLVIWFRGRRW